MEPKALNFLKNLHHIYTSLQIYLLPPLLSLQILKSLFSVSSQFLYCDYLATNFIFKPVCWTLKLKASHEVESLRNHFQLKTDPKEGWTGKSPTCSDVPTKSVQSYAKAKYLHCHLGRDLKHELEYFQEVRNIFLFPELRASDALRHLPSRRHVSMSLFPCQTSLTLYYVKGWQSSTQRQNNLTCISIFLKNLEELERTVPYT